MEAEFTAFQETAAYVRQLLEHAVVDFRAFQRKISRCDLADCHGTCCHDGVFLNRDEAPLIRELARTQREALLEFGCELPERPVVFGKSEFASGPKTATKPAPMRKLVRDYPAHFEETQCVFLTPDARCGLQLLAESEGRHPWFFKPFTCWIHPISIEREPGGGTRLTLHDQTTDPQHRTGYEGFVSRTGCGRDEVCGQPAFQVLSDELKTLGDLAGRDFLGEIQAWESESDFH